MAEENLVEHEVHALENEQYLDNVNGVDDAHVIDNVHELKNTHDTDNTTDAYYTENVGNTHDADSIPDNSHHHEETQGGAQNETGGVDEKKWPGWPGENVFRMLVPIKKVGGIIGRKGEYIKKICEETQARVKILDGPPGTTERTVMVSAKEEPHLPVPPAIDGLLRVHKRVVDVDTDPANAPPSQGRTVCTRLLVAASQAASLIGKQGATVKSIQDTSHCNIRVLGGEHLPVFAIPDDSVVEVQGEPSDVHKAVELIASQLRNFLVDRSVIGVFETQMQMANSRVNQSMPPSQSWAPPQGFHVGSGGGSGFGPGPHYMPPPRQFDNYYQPTDMPPLEKQPRQGPPPYGRDAPAQPQQSIVTKVTQNMQIPLSYADAVIGNSGANISYIRRTSGASIAIQESRGTPDEMTVEINGSASQVQTAQQLIQNFIADASSSMQNAAGGPPAQSYNPYHSQGQSYAAQPPYTSQPPTAAGQASYAPAADYGSYYGASYGY